MRLLVISSAINNDTSLNNLIKSMYLKEKRKAYAIAFIVICQSNVMKTPNKYPQDMKWTPPETAAYDRPRSEQMNERGNDMIAIRHTSQFVAHVV